MQYIPLLFLHLCINCFPKNKINVIILVLFLDYQLKYPEV